LTAPNSAADNRSNMACGAFLDTERRSASAISDANCCGQTPDLDDRQRDCASIVVWSRITGTECIFAPHPLRDQQPADIAEQWRQRAHVTFARVRDDTGHPRDAALNQILTAYAQWLIRAIDATGTTPPEPWTGTHPQASGGVSTRDLDCRPHR
jgi:hypothetical protein